MSNLPGYLTTAEVADALGLTRQRIRQIVAELGGVKVGREWVFPTKKVEKAQGQPRPKRGWPAGKPRKKGGKK